MLILGNSKYARGVKGGELGTTLLNIIKSIRLYAS
jgi:hypothetical protein